MVADLSQLQTAQDKSVKPSMSNTLEIGKLPGIPPHKGSWYSVVDNKFAQTPQVVPQAFSDIAKPGYRSGPPASVQHKDLVKLEYMTQENISIANSPLSGWQASQASITFTSQGTREKGCFMLPQMGPLKSRSCYNCSPWHNRNLLRCNFCWILVGICQRPTQTWYPISSPHSKTWFWSDTMPIYVMITPTWMLSGYATFAPISGGDLFERSLMQEYEQHLIGLGIKPGSKKEQCFHPCKKRAGVGVNRQERAGVGVNRLHKGYTTNPCWLHNIWCSSPPFNLHLSGEDMVVAEGAETTSSMTLNTMCYLHKPLAPQGVYYQPMLAPQYMVQQPSFQPPPEGVSGEDVVVAEGAETTSSMTLNTMCYLHKTLD